MTIYFKEMNALKWLRPKSKKKPSSGIATAWPFFASEVFSNKKETGKVPPANPEQAPKPTTLEAPAKTADEQVRQIMLDSPDMNAATLYNTMKAKGLDVVDKVEAEGGSANVAALRSKESSSMNFRVKLVESAASDNGVGHTRFKTILIQEGLGNLKDGYYYTKEALASAVPIFEGKKIYADHPSAIDEQTRPERSVRDILGHFENVRLEEGSDGQSMLTADVVTLPDDPYRWARALMRHAVSYSKQYPDKDFVGLSINATGDAEPKEVSDFLKEMELPKAAIPKLQKAVEQGLSTVKVVSVLHDAVSVDLVTEAGAGGKILQLLEMEKKMDEKKIEKEEVKQADAPHGDEAQDIELIKKMLKDYLGDEEAESVEACEAGKQAYEAYKEMGKESEEALKCAGEAMKLAKHMAAKTKEAAPKEEPKDEEKKDEEKCEADAKESSAIAQLKGENAKLKESLKKFEIATYLDKKLKESKESRQVTDAFRELVKTAKTTGEIDKLWESFNKGLAAAGEKTSKVDAPKYDLDFFVATEKQTVTVTESNKIDFSSF
jgi:hypothetical protein